MVSDSSDSSEDDHNVYKENEDLDKMNMIELFKYRLD
jgi:hypothetical protein